MIQFFKGVGNIIFAVHPQNPLTDEDTGKLSWLFGNAELLQSDIVDGLFIGPRKEMITPWSTNTVEITQNMGIGNILRIEEFHTAESENVSFDPMLKAMYQGLGQDVFTIDIAPEPVLEIEDIDAYNKQEGLALSADEVAYLEGVGQRIGRKLTDSEVFGFSQVNSEHCRHKIFNGVFVIDGQEKPSSLFKLIRKTSEANDKNLVSAYKDNVAFMKGPKAEQFAPKTQNKPDSFTVSDFESVYSLKAETHNFPTTVEPFNGAATGAGGEIRDRMAGGVGSMPLAGTAVYMTSYSRLEEGRDWEKGMEEREWLYQTPMEILIKASNGASDFGNKFGQPLICGSVLTFEHEETDKRYGFDKVIMMAGGIGYGKHKDSLKHTPKQGDKIVVMGGDNYRIGMGGGAVSSVATGEFSNAIELNAIQRSNPEMQKRVYNAIRALAETEDNPVVSLHDHGAGGHLNCLSELVEETGGKIDLHKLPVGDPTLSSKEIVGNESQERMGLVMPAEHTQALKEISERERAPMYEVGETTGDMRFTFEDTKAGKNPIDLKLEDMFGKPPKTIMNDKSVNNPYAAIAPEDSQWVENLKKVLQLEAVASKDWLTNKVDRSVTGRVAKQQTCGSLQLPLNDVAVMALDFRGERGIATSIGHAPAAALISPTAGSKQAIAETLTNLIWAPIEGGLPNVSLSANWMWPCKNKGEDARLYEAVEAVSDFAIALGVNIPTGKDSLSMTQKYKDGVVYSPGTVIISAAAECSDVKKVLSPVAQAQGGAIYYIDFSKEEKSLGGSSYPQVINKLGNSAPSIADAAYFAKAFTAVQELILNGNAVAGHDISAGGLITALLEMVFAENDLGLDVQLDDFGEESITSILFSENSGVLVQAKENEALEQTLSAAGISFLKVANVIAEAKVNVQHGSNHTALSVSELRDTWMKTSYLLDKQQSGAEKAKERFDNYKAQSLSYAFSETFKGKLSDYGISMENRGQAGVKAAIIREKGVNGDREMAYAMFLAGFDVRDVHMTDLIAGRENLEDVNFIVFVGGFSNSDVLGSAKGWAGAFLYNPKAKQALDNFYARPDTMSLGVCNGCQLMVELGLVGVTDNAKAQMLHNDTHKFESGFVNVTINDTPSVMLSSMKGQRLGVWIAHGEGKFELPAAKDEYAIALEYSYAAYPGNPNGSAYNAAGICSADGRHLAMMPHLERAIFPWNWAHYPERNDEVSPWIEAFVNAREWVKSHQ